MHLNAVRGMLLEESALSLLRRAGYIPVTAIGSDTTLHEHAAGLGIAVKGRGAKHQIDAIADYQIGQPFSHPQRLLVEAKCYTNKKNVDLDTIRSAVGVVKDVSEYWATLDGLPVTQHRYHYQKAIFSATAFTPAAERYAFAHDIYLFPMGRSSCFKGLLSAIFAVKAGDLKRGPWVATEHPLRTLRLTMRNLFEDLQAGHGYELGNSLQRVVNETGRLGGVVVALVSRAFPLFLVPRDREILSTLPADLDVRIRWVSTKGWTITDRYNRVLFSFDLPPVLFYMYSRAGVLTRESAATMKELMFESLQAVVFDGAAPRVVRFHPEPEWFAALQRYARDNAEPLLRSPAI